MFKGISPVSLIIRFGVIFFALSMSATLFIYPLYLTYENIREKNIIEQEEGYLQSAKNTFQKDIFEVLVDTAVFIHSPSFVSYLDHDTEEDRKRVENIFFRIVNAYGRYDQLRLIDSLGNEKIRVNYNKGNPETVAKSGLQNKADRYYFTEAIKLGAGEVYISPMDLNQENGKLEIPYKPMVRFSMPVFDSFGNKKGVLVVNFLAELFLKNFKQLISQNDLHRGMLLNQDGYWLSCINSENEFGFDKNMHEKKFSKKFPDEWQKISTQSNEVFKTKNGLFLYDTIYLGKNNFDAMVQNIKLTNTTMMEQQKKDYFAKIVLFVPQDSLVEGSFFYQPIGKVILFGVYFLIALFSFSTAFYTLRNKLQLELAQKSAQEMESLARTDVLTGLCNRRYFYELGELERLRSQREKKSMAVVMLDIDFFKAINDIYGHDGGDKVLTMLGAVIKNILRSTDVLGRLGGEEFGLILHDISLLQAHEIIERIRSALEQLDVVLDDGRVIKFTVSLGISMLESHHKHIEAVLKEADIALYEAKNGGRNRISVFNA